MRPASLAFLTILGFTGALFGQKAEIVQSSPAVDPYLDGRWYANGDVVALYGNNLASGTDKADFASGTKQLAGVSVYYIPKASTCDELQKPRDSQDPGQILACGQRLDLVYVGPSQINLLLPWSVDGLDASGTTRGILVLVRDGNVDAYLQRGDVTLADSQWQPFPLYMVNGPVPQFVVTGFSPRYAKLGQSAGAALAADPQHSVPFAAITHGDYSSVTSANPIRNGETLAVWLTGAGQMTACGGLLCGQASAVEFDVVFRYGSKLYAFPTKTEFFGALPTFPWLQQLNMTVRVCAQGTSAQQPQALDARLTLRILDASGPVLASQMAALPLVTTGSAEDGTRGFSFDVESATGSWQDDCLQY